MKEESVDKSQMQNKIVVTNIQRFSINDGPGIRSTVFLKGCSICCPWCSNPENIRKEPQQFKRSGFIGTYGRIMTSKELAEECKKDRVYYGKIEKDNWNIKRAEEISRLPGGVTFSGGEPLLQMEKLVPVCEVLHLEGIHIAVETSLFASDERLRLAMDNIDFFYCDVKIMDKFKAMEIEKADLDVFYNNFEMLIGSKLPVVIRIPVIGGKTDDVENRKAVHSFLNKYKGNILKIELIKEHNLASDKYESLNMEVKYEGVSDELMNKYERELKCLNIPVEILRL